MAVTWLSAETARAVGLTATASVDSNVSCAGGSNGSASVVVTGGSGNYVYSWIPSGGVNTAATGLSAGTYHVDVFDSDDGSLMASSNGITITEPSVLTASPAAQTNIACRGGATGSASVNVVGGTGGYTYSWSPAGGTAATASGLTSGTYTVTVKDANLCQTTQSFTITQPATALVASPAQTNVACNSGSNGVASVTASGGTPGYTYLWSNGGTTSAITGLLAGTYTGTVTDANGCQSSQTIMVTQPSALTATSSGTDVSCNGGTNGTATVAPSGGVGGYTYSWAPAGGTGATASGLQAGTYTATITDANSCQTTQGYTVTQPPAIALTASQTNIACNGGATGSATVAASGGTGGYTYAWSPTGGTAATASSLTAGSYTVTVKDASLCPATHDYTLSQPASALAASATAITNVACNAGTNGSATITATGGTAAYTYRWSPGGETSATVTGKAANTYTVVTTDANACTTSTNVQITEPSAIVVSLASSTPDGCGDTPSGSVTVSASGGTGAFTYAWTPGTPQGDGTASISDLAEGTYSVNVSDINGCFADESYDVVFKDDAAPIGLSQSVSATEDSTKAITLGSTYTGCQDLVYAVIAAPAHGTLTGTAPSLTYTPTPGYSGADAFSFTVTADTLVSAEAVVSITVTALPDDPVSGSAPSAASMTVTTTIGTPVAFTLSASDPDGDELTYSVQIPPQFGTLSGTAPLLTYTPTAVNAYEDHFTFIVNDGAQSSTPATVLVKVGDPATDNIKQPTPVVSLNVPNDDKGCSALVVSDLVCFGVAMFAMAYSKRRRKRP